MQSTTLTTAMIFKIVVIISILCSIAGALSQGKIKSLLKAHNKARRKVAPRASNMLEMKWSGSIAAFAQEYAERCVFRHSSNNERVNASGTSYDWIGENLYLTSANRINVKRAVKSWIKEKINYSYSNNHCSGICGHYTQVVWANSFELGCGVTFCTNIAESTITSGTILVCQYGPGGNYADTLPYVRGVPCDACPSSKPFCNKKLCSSNNA